MMLGRLLIASLVLLLPASSWAAITYVSTTDSTDTRNVSSVTTSVTVAAGTDRILTYCSQVRNGASTAFPISSIVRNGQSFTRARNPDTRVAADGTLQTEFWYLAAPTTGSANVVATYTGANSQALGGTINQFDGVSQTSPIDSHAGSNGTGTAVAATITTIADNAAIIDCAMGRHDNGLTIGAGQTQRTDRMIGNTPQPSSFNDGAGVSTVVTKTPAGAEVMNWTQEGFQWAISAVSLTPSGGTDAAPAVSSQVTLGWTNGTDPGSPSSGIASTTIRRCTGTSCNATTAPAIGTRAYPFTSFDDTTVQTNTTYGYSVFHTDGMGLVSTNHPTVRITTSGTPPADPPTIASAVFDNDGVTITPGAVVPTKVKIWTFTSTNTISSLEYTWASLTAGRHNEEWRDGLQGGCVSAIDAAGIENRESTAYQCSNFSAFVGPIDTTPPTLSNCQPTGTLPAGTTEWTVSCDVNKPETTAKYDTTDMAYASMANTMALNSLTFSATKTGLTNGSTTPLYLRPAITDINDTVYPALTSTVVTLTVAAAAGDVTPPGDVASLVGTLLGNAVSLGWAAATDAVRYQVYQALGDCSVYAPAGNPVAATRTQLSLQFGVGYCWKVKGLDAANNLSTNFSNIVTKTIGAAPDIERPSQLGPFTVSTFTRTVLLTWPLGTDNSSIVFTNIEYCQVATGQTDCANFSVLVSRLTQTFLTPQNLTPGTGYCFRGKNSDPTGNVSLNYNTPVCVTTPTTGLPSPRITLPFGVDRPSGTRLTR